MNYKDIIKHIKEKRIALGMSQKEFANQIPMKQSKYNKIENLRLEASFDELQLILSNLNLTLSLRREDKKKPTVKYYD